MRKLLVVLVLLFGGCAPDTEGWPAYLWRQDGVGHVQDRVLLGTMRMEGPDTCVLRLKDGGVMRQTHYLRDGCYSALFHAFTQNMTEGEVGWGDDMKEKATGAAWIERRPPSEPPSE